MSISVIGSRFHVLDMRTRMPFKYGIAALTALPHLFVEITLEIDGQPQTGLASEGLPPKWFTKNPDTRFEQDLVDMLAVIEAACRHAEQADAQASPFDIWWRLYEQQQHWGESEGHPPLLWGLGVSLVERAMLDAWCRAHGTTFAAALHGDALGLRLGRIHPELEGLSPSALLPAQPVSRTAIRHTVGLGDPLADDEIADDERTADGLPQSLSECVQQYGLRYFKIKLCGELQRDRRRLKQITAILDAANITDLQITLDGNEQYRDVAAFRAFWESLAGDRELDPLLTRLIVVEQPLHRDVALDAATGTALRAWAQRPPMIIDESDATLDSLRLALDAGYVGTSHKNCKGVFRGIANACLLAHRQGTGDGKQYVLTGEDLANVGPVALLQDLAVMATLGLDHVERNGHHYFRGLSMLPDPLQSAVLQAHGDLYRPHPQGFPTLNITQGEIDLTSVNNAPFGVAVKVDRANFMPYDQWQATSEMATAVRQLQQR